MCQFSGRQYKNLLWTVIEVFVIVVQATFKCLFKSLWLLTKIINTAFALFATVHRLTNHSISLADELKSNKGCNEFAKLQISDMQPVLQYQIQYQCSYQLK